MQCKIKTGTEYKLWDDNIERDYTMNPWFSTVISFSLHIGMSRLDNYAAAIQRINNFSYLVALNTKKEKIPWL